MAHIRLKPWLFDWLIAFGLFGLALWLRMANLTHFVTADEHNWVYRSGLFLNAVLRQDWSGTSVWYTPAVTTTWLGSGSLALFFQANQTTIDRPLVEWLTSFSRNKIDLDILLALRWSIVLFTSAMAAVVYGLARKLWPVPLALLGSLFLITEPHLLAVSRIIGHDALITFLVVSSLLSILYAKRFLSRSQTPVWERDIGGIWDRVTRYRWFVVSGIFAGLAILSKAPAIILIPFVGLIAVVDVWQNRDRLVRWLWGILIWGGVLWLTFILVWPAAWLDPLGQSWFVISSAFFSSTGLEDADIQPFWSIPNLGYFYYVVNGAFKVSPFLMIGTLLAGAGGLYKIRRHKVSWSHLLEIELCWLVIFTLLFTLMMTFGAKKSPRYILPTFPALSFVAAWGWLTLSKLPAIARYSTLQRFWKTGTIVVLGSLAIWLTLNYAPYYFTYFNPLLGGAITAPKIVRVGWGEGLDEIGRWLDTQPDAPVEHVGARYTAALFPFYQGGVSSPVSDELDYVAFYIKQSQSGYPAPEILAYFENQSPLHRVELNGIEYAQVYQGPGAIPIKIDAADMPLAYRPDTIYAPLGNQLNIDLLWDMSPSNDDLVKLTLQSSAGTITLESEAKINDETKGVRLSKHHFKIPDRRETYTLWLNDQSLGEIKARLLDIPADFRSLDAVLAGQLKLAGIRQTMADQHLHLDLAWQGWPQANNDFTVFIQLLDDEGHRINGVDVAPEQGFTHLDRKEVMLTHYDIPLPDNLQPNTYSLLVGLYYFAGDELINVGAVTLDMAVVIE